MDEKTVAELREWLKECTQVQNEIVKSGIETPMLPAVFEKAIRPFHYFKQERRASGNSSRSCAGDDLHSPGAAPLFSVKVSGKTYDKRQELKALGLLFVKESTSWEGKIPEPRLAELSRLELESGGKLKIVVER